MKSTITELPTIDGDVLMPLVTSVWGEGDDVAVLKIGN